MSFIQRFNNRTLDDDLEVLKLVIDAISFNDDAVKHLKETLAPIVESSSFIKLIDGPSSLLDVATFSSNFKYFIEHSNSNTPIVSEFTSLINKITNYFQNYDKYHKDVDEKILSITDKIKEWEEEHEKIEKILTSPHSVLLSLKKKLKDILKGNQAAASKKATNFKTSATILYRLAKSGWNISCLKYPSIVLYEELGFIKEYCYYGYVTCLSFGPQEVFICLLKDHIYIRIMSNYIEDSSYFTIQDVPEEAPFKRCVDLLNNNSSYRVQFALEDAKRAFQQAYASSLTKERPDPELFKKAMILPSFFEPTCPVCKEYAFEEEKQFCENCGKWVCKNHMGTKIDVKWSREKEAVCDNCVQKLKAQ